MTLPAFEGRDVMRSTIKITAAGDGLSEPLAIDPQVFHHGDEVYVVLKTECVDVSHPEIKDTETLQRTHKLKALEGMIVDEQSVAEMFETQRRRIREAKGTPNLDDELANGD